MSKTPGGAIVIDSKKTLKWIKKLEPEATENVKYEDVKDKIFVFPDSELMGLPVFMTAREFLQKYETVGHLTFTLTMKK